MPPVCWVISNLRPPPLQHHESKSGVSSSLTSSLPQTKDQLIWLNVIIVREKLLPLLLLINNRTHPAHFNISSLIYRPFVVEKTEMSYNLTLLYICVISSRPETIQYNKQSPPRPPLINVFAMVDTDCGWYDDDDLILILIHISL